MPFTLPLCALSIRCTVLPVRASATTSWPVLEAAMACVPSIVQSTLSTGPVKQSMHRTCLPLPTVWMRAVLSYDPLRTNSPPCGLSATLLTVLSFSCAWISRSFLPSAASKTRIFPSRHADTSRLRFGVKEKSQDHTQSSCLCFHASVPSHWKTRRKLSAQAVPIMSPSGDHTASRHQFEWPLSWILASLITDGAIPEHSRARHWPAPSAAHDRRPCMSTVKISLHLYGVKGKKPRAAVQGTKYATRRIDVLESPGSAVAVIGEHHHPLVAWEAPC